MKTLIADDDAISRRMLESALQNCGYRVTVACDGDEAWRILQIPEPPQLLVLDWLMPGLAGVAVCRRVRDNFSINYVYVLILTAKTQGEDLLVAMEAGADDYVIKPFKSQELRARLRAGCRIIELEEHFHLVRRSEPIPINRVPSLAS